LLPQIHPVPEAGSKRWAISTVKRHKNWPLNQQEKNKAIANENKLWAARRHSKPLKYFRNKSLKSIFFSGSASIYAQRPGMVTSVTTQKRQGRHLTPDISAD
jgi:hypothetical protein